MICGEEEGGKFSPGQTGFEGGVCGLGEEFGSHQYIGGDENHSYVCSGRLFRARRNEKYGFPGKTQRVTQEETHPKENKKCTKK